MDEERTEAGAEGSEEPTSEVPFSELDGVSLDEILESVTEDPKEESGGFIRTLAPTDDEMGISGGGAAGGPGKSVKTRRTRRGSSAATPEDLVEGMVIPQNLKNWLKGIQPNIPPEISKMMGTFVEKINWTVAFLIVQNVGRISHLIGAIREMEEIILNPEELKSAGTINDLPLEPKEILSVYKQANSSLIALLEFVRKFTGQQGDLLSAGMGEADELAHVLRELSPEVLQEIRGIIEKHGKGKRSKSTE